MSDKIVSLHRKRLAREKGAVRKDWGGKLTIALAYPNHYRTGMSNLGFQVVYHLLNKKRNVVAERLFLPEPKELSLHVEGGKGLLSLESQSPIQRFDLIAFSISFENDYPNILTMLQLGKIPLQAQERDASHPLVMAGGITTFLNPEPLSPFIDFFLLGEAESILDEFVDVFTGLHRQRNSRKDTLKTLARHLTAGYVPSLYHLEYHRDGTIKSREPTESHVPAHVTASCASFRDKPVATSTIFTPETVFADRVLIELGRGCGRSCRFCAAGYVYRAPRTHGEDALISRIEEAAESHERFGLLSAAVSDTPGIEHITGLILKKGGTFSVSSLRADSLTPGLLEDLKRAGQKSIAIAPEAGSERLRRVINKHLSHDQIVGAVRLIGGTEGFSLRLYFLMGLPTETLEDIEEILGLVKSIRHHLIKTSRDRGRIGEIKLSVNCFIPKPFTPFQWFPMENAASLKAKQKRLRQALARVGGIRVSFDVPKWAYVQSLLSLGDRRVGSILLRAHEFQQDWGKAFRHSALNPDFFVYRPRGLDEILPWDFIDHGINKEYLIKEYKLALKGKESEPCHVGDCKRCGVCP